MTAIATLSPIELPGPAPIELRGLNEAVYQQVKAQLVSRRFAVEERLSLKQLAEQLEVSRSPVHQALTRLASEGLVTVRSRRGYYVAPLTIEAVSDAYDVRLAFELHAAERTVGHLDAGQLAELERHADDAAAHLGDPDAKEHYIAANIRFHDYIVALARNPTMLGLYRQLSINLMMRRILDGHSLDVDELDTEHRFIVAAFARADLPAARDSLADHVESGKRLAAAAIAAAGGSL